MPYTGFGGSHWCSLVDEMDIILTFENWWVEGNLVVLVQLECDSVYKFKLRNNEIRDDREEQLIREIDAHLCPSTQEVSLDGGRAAMHLKTGGESILTIEFHGSLSGKFKLEATRPDETRDARLLFSIGPVVMIIESPSDTRADSMIGKLTFSIQ